jgi:hypothetical protein
VYCLSDEDAEQAADIFRELIQNYSDDLALAALTEDFVDYSSAVAIIINGGDGEPLDIEKPLFVGRQAFMDAQGSQPEIPFKKLQRFHGCDSVSMRWLTRRSANGQETETARIVSAYCDPTEIRAQLTVFTACHWQRHHPGRQVRARRPVQLPHQDHLLRVQLGCLVGELGRVCPGEWHRG